ncbi:MAG: hypothetical protein IJK58_08055 [Clostridia bacterium]|nr:hypothetical protein [Clostridia bacterium]
MDNVPETGEPIGSKRGMSKAARSVLSSVFAFAAAFGAAYFFGAGRFGASALVFFVSAFVMTFIFTHQKGLLFSLVPFVLGYFAVLLPGVDRLLALIALCAVLLFSAAVSVLIIRRAERFFVFLLSSALFFAVFSGVLLLLLSDSTGSVTVAAERLSGASKTVVGEMIRIAGQNGLSAGEIDADALSGAVTALVPAAVMIVSMISSLIFTALFGLAARIAGTRELLLPGEFTATRPFAVVYILVTLLSFMTGFIPAPWSYVILNVDYVMMAIFFVVGIKSLVRSARARRTGGRFIAILIAAAAATVFFGGTVASLLISILIPLLSYVGAFRSLKSVKDKGSEDNEQ